MAGRPKKPKIVKELKGTLRPWREKPSLELPPEVPEPPEWLAGEARAEFDRVVAELGETGLLTRADRGSLAVYCCLWDEFAQSSRGGSPVNLGLLAELRRYAALFGLDPSSREKLPPARSKKEPATNKWAL
ncbi:MAG: P27 family phage terminase small subunit [Desulfovibrionaceae bacterium]